jgi:hypothetical protein
MSKTAIMKFIHIRNIAASTLTFYSAPATMGSLNSRILPPLDENELKISFVQLFIGLLLHM